MKKTLLIFIVLIVASCTDNFQKNERICAKPENIAVFLENNEELGLQWEVNEDSYSHFEIKYGEQGFNVDQSSLSIFHDQLRIKNLLNVEGTYDFYVRTICSNDQLLVSDWAGPLTYDFVIPDVTIPIITLNGSSTIDLDLGDSYIEYGATAFDNIDGDISESIIISGDVVDTNVVGQYLLKYNVSDLSGNAAEEVVRTVNVIPCTPVEITNIDTSITYSDDENGSPVIPDHVVITWSPFEYGSSFSYRIKILLHGQNIDETPVRDVLIHNDLVYVEYALIDGQVYDIYGRTECPEGANSEWFGPVILNYD